MSDPGTFRKLTGLERRLHALETVERPRTNYGTSNPTGWPNNVPFYRTDLGWWIYYDGTRWLTAYELTADFTPNPSGGAPTTVAPNDLLFAPMRTDYSIYIGKVKLMAYVSTTNNGTNFYTARLLTSGGTAIYDISTSASAANTLLTFEATHNGVQSGTYYAIRTLAKTGAPGAIFLNGTFWYRLVIP